ncbi:RagB/SusD family nutrient uptake outer membrane protein [Parasediminibacterium paludis]|uniref:RagB/SusD family nutrient uptake outer membrane protein n=1 Tax=Parasediminibacterium paludis TaxID=908966 RepID=A0ABV8PYI9_9BACT
MKSYKNLKKIALPVFAVIALSACTKLDEGLNSTLTSSQVSSSLGTAGTGLLLSAAYSDLAGPFHGQDQVFSLEENTTDESLVPTRGGDWDDNGVWRVLHSHTWNADHGQILSVFNNLNKLNFDATNVLGFNPSKSQAAEARFLRALSLYYLLDLYGQYPFRNPGDNLLNAPVVKSGADGINFIISELTAALPDLPASNGVNLANPDACRTLLMKCYLNKGMYINRAAPTFDPADMAQVITLGNAIINSGKYSYTKNYFDNFNVANDSTKEGIFTYMNTSGVAANHGGIEARWNMTLHYNSYTPNNPNAGWNGFSTISDFYNSFNTTTTTTAFGPADTLFDTRLGGRYYKSATDISGLRPGLLVGQQYNEKGAKILDRKGAPLAYTPAIAANMIETGANLEQTGIRVVKYVPDYTGAGNNQYYGGPAGNDLMIFRYPDVVLMVAEAQMRTGATAAGLTLVNGLRAARGAAPFVTLPLVNPSNVDDPNTLLAERGRELYWESHRRTDLLRFNVYLKPWGLKPTDDAKNLYFPIPNQALAANPNLKQNPGY